jgi:hypothetical protein
MNRNEATAVVFSMILTALPLAASAQTPAPNAPSGAAIGAAPQQEPKVPTSTRRDAPPDVDARHCLEFATNLEVIACAEKYRSHKGKG